MRGLLGVCVLSGVLVLACSCRREEAPAAVAVVPAVAAPASGTPRQTLLDQYLIVQQRLAADDAPGARAAFLQLKAAADAPELGGDASLRGRLSGAAAAGSSAKDLPAARDAFFAASEGMLAWLKREGNPLDRDLRVAQCPMARNGTGARWVQSVGKLANPYYGAEMLECGSIEGELRPGVKLQ